MMAMNNVYYRFVHLASNPEYGTMPARLRMNVIGSHGIDEGRFRAVQPRGLGDERLRHVHRQPRARTSGARREAGRIQSAVRIAAVMKAIATVHATL